MITVAVILSILNQLEFHLIQNRNENSHQDHIPFNLKGNGNLFSDFRFLPVCMQLHFILFSTTDTAIGHGYLEF